MGVKRAVLDDLRMDPADKTVIYDPPRDALDSFITDNDEHYVLVGLGVAHQDDHEWCIEIIGDLDNPSVLDLATLMQMPQTTFCATLECAGDPLRPDLPVRRVSTARWTGVTIASVLELAGLRSTDGYLWMDGADHGVYRPGSAVAERVSYYRKDIPLERAVSGGALLATHMNGVPITPIHGAPVRALIPGYYGTNSVKWIRRLIVASGRPSGLFASVMYNDPVIVDGAIERRQAGRVGVNSLVTSHDQGARLAVGVHAIAGWAWGDLEVANVVVQVDDGATARADLGPREDFAWQRFTAQVTLDRPGTHSIAVRATDVAGDSQPDDVHINQAFRLEVQVD